MSEDKLNQIIFLSVFSLLVIFAKAEQYVQPQQIHLAIADETLFDTGHKYIVTWSTLEPTKHSYVNFGLSPRNLNLWTKYSETTKFVDPGKSKRTQYIHRVELDDLLPGQFYYYRVGNVITMSEIFFFQAQHYTPQNSSTSEWKPMTMAIYGDMGNVNSRSLELLQSKAQSGQIDMVAHIGDFGYDLQDDEGKNGDEFLKRIEPIAGYVPYMTVPGNHESHVNFTQYKNRFSMPQRSPEEMFYSFNLGPVHYVMINTEYYFWPEFFNQQATYQYEWLESDLEVANQPQNRALRPWIIFMGHRPMYCSIIEDSRDCRQKLSKVRFGIPTEDIPGLEELLHAYKVDMAFFGHNHQYERLWPVNDYLVDKSGCDESHYHNAKAPIHIIVGSAGCKEESYQFVDNPSDFSLFRSSDYGFITMKVHNRTHLEFHQVSDKEHGLEDIDSFWVTKDLPKLRNVV